MDTEQNIKEIKFNIFIRYKSHTRECKKVMRGTYTVNNGTIKNVIIKKNHFFFYSSFKQLSCKIK